MALCVCVCVTRQNQNSGKKSFGNIKLVERPNLWKWLTCHNQTCENNFWLSQSMKTAYFVRPNLAARWTGVCSSSFLLSRSAPLLNNTCRNIITCKSTPAETSSHASQHLQKHHHMQVNTCRNIITCKSTPAETWPPAETSLHTSQHLQTSSHATPAETWPPAETSLHTSQHLQKHHHIHRSQPQHSIWDITDALSVSHQLLLCKENGWKVFTSSIQPNWLQKEEKEQQQWDRV